MNIFDNIPDNKNIFKSPVVTIGNFDGVHLGHKKIFERLLKEAALSSSDHIVLTFKQHPKSVLFPEKNFKYIYTIDERTNELRNLGIKNTIMIDFTKYISELSPLDFVNDILVKCLKISALVMGYDHSFGKSGKGTIDHLKKYADSNFDLFQISPCIYKGSPVSSTRIRNYLNEGDVFSAAKLLGRSYYLSGCVVKGEQRGRKLGYPTANIGLIPDDKIIPGDGVYFAKVKIEDSDQVYNGMLNVGNNPTFENSNRTVEVNILSFDRDIYDKHIYVEFVKKIRDEIKFSSVEELIVAIDSDKKIIEKEAARNN